MTILQLTEPVKAVIDSASQESSPFIILFMLLVIIAESVALVMLHKENLKRDDRSNEVVISVKTALNDLTRAIDSLSIEQRSTRARLDNLSDYIREEKR